LRTQFNYLYTFLVDELMSLKDTYSQHVTAFIQISSLFLISSL